MEKLYVISVNYPFIPSDALFQILDVCHMQLVNLCQPFETPVCREKNMLNITV